MEWVRYLKSALVCAIKVETFDKVTNEDVMTRFQAINTNEDDKSINYLRFYVVYHRVF